jgi:hypothetical protein
MMMMMMMMMMMIRRRKYDALRVLVGWILEPSIHPVFRSFGTPNVSTKMGPLKK